MSFPARLQVSDLQVDRSQEGCRGSNEGNGSNGIDKAVPSSKLTLSEAVSQWERLLSGANSRGNNGEGVPVHNSQSDPSPVVTVKNRRENHAWGDELKDKPPHHTRIFVQNVNGRSLQGRGGKFDTVCRVLKEVL